MAKATDRPDRWAGVTAIGGLVSVVLLGLTLYLTNDFNRQQLAANDRGQRSQRMVTAVEQLASGKVQIRLGGVYGLAAVMHESDADRTAVIDVLNTFIRTSTAPASDRSRPARAEPSDPDVRAAVTVLAHRPKPAELPALDFTDAVLGLHGQRLSGGDLTGAYLRNADLRYADLSGTELKWADLTSVDLFGADLRNARLSDTTGLTTPLLKCVWVDEKTTLPTGVEPPPPGPPAGRKGC